MGASENEDRYSNMAIRKLRHYGHEVVAIGKKKGKVDDVEIDTGKPRFSDIHTVTLYLSARNQEEYLEYLVSLGPDRIIFNPGAENKTLYDLCLQNKIEAVEACTLVLLSIGGY
jgi:predicted CoA-binding protein